MNKKSIKKMTNEELMKEVLELRSQLYKTNNKNKELVIENKELGDENVTLKRLNSQGFIAFLIRLIKRWFNK